MFLQKHVLLTWFLAAFYSGNFLGMPSAISQQAPNVSKVNEKQTQALQKSH
jgi:hypothetical protein